MDNLTIYQSSPPKRTEPRENVFAAGDYKILKGKSYEYFMRLNRRSSITFKNDPIATEKNQIRK